MNTRKGLLLLSLFFCCLPGAMFAQVVSIERGREANKGTMNFTSVSNYLLAHPEPLIQQEKKNRTFDLPRNRPVTPSVLAARPTARTPLSLIPAGPGTPLPMSPAPTDTFQAVLDNSTTIPPDTHGAVDGTYCITAVNPNVRIQTRSGGSVSVVSLNSFFTSVNSANGVFDPRVHYDPFSNRWILVAVSGANNTSDSTSILIGVSQTSNPTGSWHLYRIRAYTAGGYWLDYPNVGINGKWVTVTGNLFQNSPGTGYGGAKVFVFNKSSLMSGAGAPFTAFTMSTSDFTLCPAFNYDASNANMFAVETWNGTAGAMKLWKITGAVGSEALTSVGFIVSPNDWHWGSNAFSGTALADFGPQSGTANKVQTNDDRVNQMILMNGKLWFSHTVFMPYSATANPTRSSVQWWQTDTAISGGLVPTVQVGLIDDNTNTNFYAFPSIAVNTQNDALIGFSRFSATTFPSAAYAMRVHTDATDSTRPVVVYRNGLANYYKTYGGSKNRWGDYSGTCLDPVNSLDFWTIQEASSFSNLWDTRWAHVLAPCTTPGSITGTATVCVGSTTTLANSVSGGTWSSATTSVATVNSTSGVVTGVASGTSTITYSTGGTCFVTRVVTVNALPGTISGTVTVCVGSTTTLSSSPTGGVWTSSASGTASVNSTSGVVSGVAAGTATITYTLSTGCFATKAVTVNTAPSAITGTLSVCTGSTTTLSSSPTGGVWTSSASGTASVNSTSGVVSGVAAGTATITYTLSGGCFVTAVVTVNTTPGAISGTATVCVGSTTTLSSSPTGGVWTSSASGTASVNSTSGVVTGAAAGTATITYTLSGGCFATRVVTVNVQPGAITGTLSVCTGATTTLSSSPTGGVWTSSASGTASVNSTSGVVSGVAAGTATITYTLSGGCFVTAVVTVNTTPGAISGTATVCVGSTTTLSSSPTGGVWTSSASGTASVNSTSGVVSGVAAGTATITYTLAGGCFATRVVTVNAAPGAISGVLSICSGASSTLSSSPTGGVWTSSNVTIATVGSSSGTVTGNANGTATITYTLSTGCFVTAVVTVNTTPGAISGTATVCVGSTTTLSSSPTGGVWTSSASGTASVNSTSGVVTGGTAGTATITYTLAGGCFATRVVTVNAQPGAITGVFGICTGSSSTLSSSPTGGVWTSSNTSIATVGSSTGTVTGIANGTATITYTLTGGCMVTQMVTVHPTPSSITGTATVCAGLTTTLSSTPTGGTWTSSASGTASVNSTSGVVTGGTAGTATITYTLSGGCFATRVVTVNTAPSAITGTFAICDGTSTTLSSSPTGGTWSSSNPAIAVVGSASGVVTGLTSGVNTITYTLSSGCFATQSFTVTSTPSSITGTAIVCTGLTTTLSSTPTGGTWTSSASGTASVNSTSGVVTGGTAGTATITYTLSGGCFTTRVVTVSSTTPAAITGTFSVCVSLTTTLSSATAGGTWSSSNVAQATVVAGTGVVTGVSAGTPVITYTLPSGCFTVQTITVVAAPAAISGASAVCSGATITLSSSPTGGTWTSSASGTASVNSTSGVVSGVGTGTATITYTLPAGCFVTKSITVTAAPGAITGTLTVCTGSTTTLSCSPTGGIWTSGATGTATVNSTTGVVTGVAAGTANITYSLGTGCESVATVTVNTSPTAITGTASVCIGSTTTLSSTPTGGTWTSSASGTASVNSTSGVVTGVSTGTATITYTLAGGCFTTRNVTVNNTPGAITGTLTVCTGSTTTLSCSPTGGTWTSGATGTATVNSTTGVVSGVASGTANITYSLGTGCESVATVTVNASPTAITGTAAVCIGSTTTLSSTPTGGTWTSSASGIASVNSTSGVVSGVSTGTATITYTLAGCFATRAVTVNAAPGAIIGTLAVCTGATTTLSCSPTGGTWTSGATGTATVNSTTGVVSGVASGTANITYSLGTGCESVATVTVNASPTAITGTAAVCIGSTSTLSSTPTGGIWASSASGTASVNSTSGVVAGVSTGTATITYTLAGGCFTTRMVTVNNLPTITLGTNPSVIIGTTSANLPYTATTGSPATYSIVYSSGAITAGFTNVTAVTLPATPIVLTVPGAAPSAVYTGTLTVTNATCASTGYPFSVTITSGVNTPPVFTGGSPQTFLACSFPTLNSINALLEISDPDVGNVLTWTVVSPPSHGTVLAGGTVISSGGILQPLGFNYRAAYGYLGADAFTIQVSDGAGGTATTTVNVTVNPVPAPVALTGGGGYCAGGAGVHVGIAGSAIGVNYQLYRGGVPVGSPVAGIGAGFSFGLQTVAGNYTVTASNATAPCTLFLPGSVNVIVYSLPTDFTVTGGGTYCPGGTGVTIGLSGSQTGVTYRLYRGATPVGASISGTGAAISFGLQTVAGTYTVIATMSGFTACTATMTGSAVVALYSLPTAYTVTGGGSYCPAGTGASIGLSGSDVGVNYQLYLGASAVGSPVAGTGSALSFGLVTGIGTYTVKGTSTVTGCMGNMSGSVAVSLSTLPYAFTVSGGGSFCSGGTGVNVVLGGSVSGVNYQLYNGVTPIGSPVAGTGTTINFGPQTTAGIYTVVGTNTTTGCSRTMLGSAVVNVIALPAIFTVTGGGGFCSGSTGISVGLSGSSLGVTYQLYRGGVLVGVPVAGSGSAINFGLFTVAGTYTVIARATGTFCTSNMSGSAVITVNSLPTAYTVTGGGGYCTGGTGVNVFLSNSAIGVNYQLYLGATPIGTPVAGTGSALSFGLQTAAGTYTVVATDATTGCTRTMTGSAVVTVNPLPTVFTVTGGGNFCTGGTGMAIGLSGSQSGVNYQLYRGASAVGGPVAGSGAAIGFGVHSTAGTYTVVATRTATGCISNMSGSATISVNPLPTVYTVTGGGGLCSGGTGAVVGLSGSDAGINYQLYRSTTAVGSPVAGTGSSISLGAQTVAGTYTVRATKGTTGCTTTMSGSATITVGTLPTVVSVTGGGAYCSGGVGVNVGLSASVVGTNYQLYLGGTPVGSPVAGIGAGFSFGLQTAGGIYTVIATFASSSCSSTMSGSATVTVVPLPTVYTVTGGGSYCTGGSGVSIGLSGSTPGITYKLVRSGTPVMSVTGTGTALSFGSFTTVGTYTVLAIAAGTGCSSTMSGSAVVTVDPVPVISGSIYTLLPTGSITLSASISGGAWTSSNTAVATVGSSTGIVAGASLGSTVITYTLPTGCYDVQVVSVTPTGFRPAADDEGKPTEILSEVAKISVLPNPNKGIFTVKGSLGVSEDADYQMEVFDILGRLVYTVNATAYAGQIEKMVELGAAAKGNYVLRIYSGGEYLVYRIVVDQ